MVCLSLTCQNEYGIDECCKTTLSKSSFINLKKRSKRHKQTKQRNAHAHAHTLTNKKRDLWNGLTRTWKQHDAEPHNSGMHNVEPNNVDMHHPLKKTRVHEIGEPCLKQPGNTWRTTYNHIKWKLAWTKRNNKTNTHNHRNGNGTHTIAVKTRFVKWHTMH